MGRGRLPSPAARKAGDGDGWDGTGDSVKSIGAGQKDISSEMLDRDRFLRGKYQLVGTYTVIFVDPGCLA